MSLVDLKLFEPVFADWNGRDVGLVCLDGNVGDRLIDAAARELMPEFGVRARNIQRIELDRGALVRDVDAIFVSGGGNMGSLYPTTVRQRRAALAFGRPVVVLPQSFTNADEDTAVFEKVYVRERFSLKLAPDAVLAPDLALGLRPPWVDEGVVAGTGVWLREDKERVVPASAFSLGDPVRISWRIEEYLGLASRFEHVVTDRLHFAIAALLVGRRATLLPNSYHKNRAMYETWLKALGCRWRRDAGGFRTAVDVGSDGLWKRLSAPPSDLVPWDDRPVVSGAWRLEAHGDAFHLAREDGESIGLNPSAAMVWQLCDGQWLVEEMCEALAARFERPLQEIGRDVQEILRGFRSRGLLEAAVEDRPQAPAVARRSVIEILVDSPRRRRGRTRWTARVRGGSCGTFLHYFDIDARCRDALTDRADPFVLALLPRALADGAELHVRGAPVDAALLDSLDEFGQLHRAWWPDSSRPVTIIAEEVRVRRRNGRRALSLFSGGLDSMHTLYRHRVAPDGRRNASLEAVLMGCGLDMPVNSQESFLLALENLRPVAEEAGVPLLDVVTNVRNHLPQWESNHGMALAAVLHLFAGGFDLGIVPSTAPYRLLFPWGSSPVGDHLLGGAFAIRHDSAALTRPEKLRAVAGWPSALSRLRVCWVDRRGDRNCGRCFKCLHLALGLQALGLRSDCFQKPPDDDSLARLVEMSHLKGLERLELLGILRDAKRSGIQRRWVEVLEARFGFVAGPPESDVRNPLISTPERTP